ncbi:MAG: hypothetical protein PHT33_02900 [bacterium]|nr:hypothetical protein [bacterium]
MRRISRDVIALATIVFVVVCFLVSLRLRDIGTIWRQKDRDTYTELIYISATTPTSGVWHYDFGRGSIMEINNCNGRLPKVRRHSYIRFQPSETLVHLGNGGLEGIIGAQCKSNAVGSLDLKHIDALPNDRQQTDVDEVQFAENSGYADVIAKPYSRIRHWWEWDYKDGNYYNQGSIEWTCRVRKIHFISPWYYGYGSYERTFFSACGSNKGDTVYSKYDSPVCDK